ncbi:hypothetical protein SNE40_017013 [Patella caerulea]|uniref:IgGFc-binding protein N-terminal domain-containing protein n=1 Tax=Patella caerulea TaxID=87958 RepID=A0AAN8P911_PATCE
MKQITIVFLTLLSVVAGEFSNRGKQFLVNFIHGHVNSQTNDPIYHYLYVSSEEAGNITVETRSTSSHQGYLQDFVLESMQSSIIKVDENLSMSLGNRIEPKGVLVSATVEVAIYVTSRDSNGNPRESYTALPVTALSTSYIVSALWTNPILNVAAVQDGTTVDIRLNTSCPVFFNFNRKTYSSHDTIIVQLDLFYVFQLELPYDMNSNCDLGGTLVTSDKPVSVLSGSSRVVGNGACGYAVEQVIPVELWGNKFLVPDLYDISDYRIRIVAGHNGTDIFVTMNGEVSSGKTEIYFMNECGVMDLDVADRSSVSVVGSRGISVTQYSLELAPFGINVHSRAHFGGNYTVTPLAHSLSYVTILILTTAQDSFNINGKYPHLSMWSNLVGTIYSTITIPLAAGQHRLEASEAFLAQVYGYAVSGTYGFTAGYILDHLPSADLYVQRPYLPHHATQGTTETRRTTLHNLPTTTVSSRSTDTPVTNTMSIPPSASSTTTPGCHDKPGISCQILETSLHICRDPVLSFKYCERFCNLCQPCSVLQPCIPIIGR